MSSSNLPLQLTSFIGRERELEEVPRLLSASRLVTLTGAGGCGKTRLAVQVASQIKDRFADGVWLIELVSLRDPAFVPQFILQTLLVPQPAGQSALESLLQHLESKEVLMVLDNCEHLIASCAQLVQQILAHSSPARILATSREALALSGETVYPLSGLACPSDDTQDGMRFDAVRLFVERARTVLPDFTLTTANAASILQICRRLDGQPLALELASARSAVLAPQQIAARLDDRFALLISRQRGGPDTRHQTLRAAIDWSYDLLAPAEQALLRRLAVFASGWTLTGAETVCSGDGVNRVQILDLLSALVEKSLVVAQTFQLGEARYALLETIRQYAQEKLVDSGEWARIRDRHLQYFLESSEEIGQKLSGQYQQLWLNRLDREYDNIRAALAWSLENAQIEAGLRIAIAVYQFWTIRDLAEEGLAWIERLLARAGEQVAAPVRANALAYAAFLAGFRGKTAAELQYGHEAAVLAEAAGEQGKPALRWALAAQAYGARAVEDYQAEFDLGQRVIQLNRELGDTYQLGLTLSIYSFSAMAIGAYDAARTMLEEGLLLLRERGNPYRIAMALNFSGDLARCQNHYARARSAYLESISLLHELGAVRDLASAYQNLGHTCLHLGEFDRAWVLFSESMSAQVAQNNVPGIAECLIGFAGAAASCGLYAASARLLAAAVAAGGERTATKWAATRMEYEHVLALVRSRLTEAQFQEEQAAGQIFALHQAIDFAQNLPRECSEKPTAGETPDDLSLRERQVAALIARGKANEEIAGDLVISQRTVEKHIANIRSKLGFTQRTQIMRWAIQTGLVESSE